MYSEAQRAFVKALILSSTKISEIQAFFYAEYNRHISRQTIWLLKNNRYVRNKRKRGPKFKTSHEEDRLILNVVKQHRWRSWRFISDLVPTSLLIAVSPDII